MTERDDKRDDKTVQLTRSTALPDSLDELPDSSSDWQPGQQVGPFRLGHPLGRGGMGMVWLAEQLSPIQRDVAIKVMLPEKRSRLGEAQFEVERQALAQLSHPAIATIHDAGQLPDGGLFLVMEYVDGIDLDAYLRRHRPDVRTLVQLIIEICQGVQHAHQKGLIHRDIKPANILIREIDGRPQPCLIDFGIAVGAGKAEGDAGSGHYARAGTLAYMAPEQHDDDVTQVDARCDVHALGAVLARGLMLIGDIGLPRVQGPESSIMRDCFKRSLDRETPNPSDPTADTIKELRALPAELRAIVTRAMAVDPEERYPSATAMADDLQHWLQFEPVRAMGDGRGYRLRCLIRRNALATTATGLVFGAMIAGTVLALYGLSEAREERAQSEQARELAERHRNDAEDLIEFMLGDFATQLRPIGRLDLLDGVADEALRYLTERGAGDDAESALSRARALRTLGEVQNRRQQFDEADTTLKQAAELLRPWQDQTDPELSELHFEAGQIAFWRGFLAYRKRDWETTETHWQNYLHHARLFAELTDDARRGREELAYAYNNLGTLAEARNDLDSAREFLGQSVAMKRELARNDDVDSVLDLANALSWTARVESTLGYTADAWRHTSEALDLVTAQREHAPEHADRRQLEINFRFILAREAQHLGLDDFSAEHLRTALALAEADVANDPGQPRRQAQLARIAFMLAGTGRVDGEEASALIERGERAMAEATEQGLDPQQAVELPARRALARLRHGLAGAGDGSLPELNEVLRTLEGRDTFDSHFFNLVELAVELIETIDAGGNQPLEGDLEMLQQQLEKVPETQRHSLRYRLSRHRLARLRSADGPDQAALEQHIRDLRKTVQAHTGDVET